MSQLGYRYGDPNEAIEDPQWKLDEPAVSAQEIAIAVANVKCRAWVEVETAWQRQAVEREPERFRRLEAAKDAQLEAAARATS